MKGQPFLDASSAIGYSIKEVSEITGVPPHQIRRWQERLPDLLCPVRTPGGQRCFTEAAVDLLRKLDQFVRLRGFTPEEARTAIQQGEEPVLQPHPVFQRADVRNAVAAVAAEIRDRVLAGLDGPRLQGKRHR